MSRPQLSKLSDRELVRSLTDLVSRERALHVEVLEYLNEVERRRLHVQMGHSSLFDYCTSRLQYSSSAAWRRIASARAMRRFPEIREMLRSGDLNLVTVAMIAKVLTPANKGALLARIVGRSQDEVRGVVAEYRPEVATRDRVRPVCVKTTSFPVLAMKRDETGVTRRTGQAKDDETVGSTRVQAGGVEGAVPDQANGGSGDSPPTVAVHKHEIKFIAGEEFMNKLEQMRDLLAARSPSPTLEQVFNVAMEAFLEAKCPLRRAERRRRRSERSQSLPPVGVDRATKPTRYIRAAVRDRVYERDGGRCTWVAPGGSRCSATRALEVDHVMPFAKGGSSGVSNLRLLCRAHNLLAAEQAYGKRVMARYTMRE